MSEQRVSYTAIQSVAAILPIDDALDDYEKRLLRRVRQLRHDPSRRFVLLDIEALELYAVGKAEALMCLHT